MPSAENASPSGFGFSTMRKSVPRIRTVADDVVGEDVARVGGEQSRLVDVALDVGHFDRRRPVEDVALESRGEGEGERSSRSAVADRVGGDSVVPVFGRWNGEFDIVRSRRQHDVGGHRDAGFDLRAREDERERVRGSGVENSVLLAERASGLEEEGKPPEAPGEGLCRHSAVTGCDPRSARREANLDRGGGLDVVHGEHRVGEAVRLQSGRHREEAERHDLPALAVHQGDLVDVERRFLEPERVLIVHLAGVDVRIPLAIEVRKEEEVDGRSRCGDGRSQRSRHLAPRGVVGGVERLHRNRCPSAA